jgi:hypothetical protein
VSYLIPKTYWKPAAVILAAAVLVTKCDWHHLWPIHDSNWRDAAQAINQANAGPNLPVVCPSPFIEAQWPVWRPDYPVSDFLYCPLLSYPIHGKIFPFPFVMSSEAEHYADSLSRTVFPATGRFIIYGGERNVEFWQKWFAARPDFANWSNRSLGTFKGINAILFVRNP